MGHADLGIESELAERFGIYITPEAYERFGGAEDEPGSREAVQVGTRDADRDMSVCWR